MAVWKSLTPPSKHSHAAAGISLFMPLCLSVSEGCVGRGNQQPVRSASYGEVMNVIQSLKDKTEKHFLNIEWQENPCGTRISNTELRIKNIKLDQCGVNPLSCNLNYLNGQIPVPHLCTILHYQLRNKIQARSLCFIILNRNRKEGKWSKIMSNCFLSCYLYSAVCRAYYNGRGNIKPPEAVHGSLQITEAGKEKISKLTFLFIQYCSIAMTGGKFSL